MASAVSADAPSETPPATLPVRIDGIPAVLRTRRQWVAWRWARTENPDKPWTKVPVDPNTGRNATTTDPSTWASVADALACAKARGLPGIGFVFTLDDPFAGIDLDGAIDFATGQPACDGAAFLVELDSYAEYSPTGTGVHILVEGMLPPGGRKRGPFECYDRGRFFTVTGHRLSGMPETVNPRTTELAAVHARVFADPPPSLPRPAPNDTASAAPMNDFEVVARASAADNGAKVRRLLTGDVSGYPSRSEADSALVWLLSFWTQDAAQLDRIFRGSRLIREKWDARHAGDGRTYGQVTIDRALDRAEIYTPPGAGPSGTSASSAAAPHMWEAPVPLADPPRPDFPTALLPPPLRAFVEALATATQTPPAMAALLCLAVLAAAAAKRVAVRVRDGWVEPVNVFVVGALRPGERKSAVFEEAVAPLEHWEAAEAKRLGPEVAAAESKAKIAEQTLERMRRAAAAEDDPAKRSELIRKATSLSQEIALTVLPEVPRALVDDCSPERLASLMSRNGGRIAAMSAEGGLFEIMAGRYAKDAAPNLDVFLKGHAGDAIRVDRVGRAPEYVRGPALTLALTVQPTVIRGLAGKPGFRGRGLLARFWYALPASLVGRRRIKPPPMPDAVRRAYADLVAHVLRLRPATAADGSPAAHPVRLSAEAAEVHLAFETELEPQLGEFGALAHAADWGGKLAGAVARLAGLLHLAAHAGHDTPWDIPVTGETMQAAVGIATGFLVPHALAAFAEMGADPALEDARLVLRWLGEREVSTVSRRDLLASLSKRFREGSQLDAALRLLCEHGYLREQRLEPVGTGRPSSPRYDVNPLWRPQNPQNPQNPQKENPEEGFVGSVDFVDSVDSVDGSTTDDLTEDEDEFEGWEHVGERLL